MTDIALVFDTSAVMALFLQEKKGGQIEQELKSLIGRNGQIFVPSLFWYEVGNTLVTAFSGGRITMDEIRGIETDLADLPIVTDPLPAAEVRHRIRELALEKHLTYYDASYVELAMRLRIPLRSFNKRVISAMDR